MMRNMRVLVLGSGGREHALAWGFARDASVTAVHVAPGNGGTERLGTNHPWDGKSFERVHELAADVGADLIVPGSEDPLVAGLYDYCLEHNLPAVGPSAAGARLEGSKAFGKEFCFSFGVPTADFKTFDDPTAAWDYVRDLPNPPVLKADGLAGGKGVLLPETRQEAMEAIAALMVERRFGKAGHTIVVEERLHGYEASLMCASDGRRLIPLAYAQDFKRAHDGDAGPNTGGMGVLSPHPRLALEETQATEQLIVDPCARGLREMGLDYRGILYIGLMITSKGPQVIEFNCRWGDPETQGIIPRLKTPLSQLYQAMRTGTLDQVAVELEERACVGVVLAAQGYPGDYPKGIPLAAFEQLESHPDVTLFHAGTTYKEGRLISSGGRVACLVGHGADLHGARSAAYHALGKVELPGLFYRSDIGAATVALR